VLQHSGKYLSTRSVSLSALPMPPICMYAPAFDPGVSSSEFLIADPFTALQRLGEWDAEENRRVIDQVSGS